MTLANAFSSDLTNLSQVKSFIKKSSIKQMIFPGEKLKMDKHPIFEGYHEEYNENSYGW